MGDTTNNHNVDAEITSWQLTQVPEPATWLVTGTMLAIAVWRRQFKR